MNKRKKKTKNDGTNRWPNGHNDSRHNLTAFASILCAPECAGNVTQLRWLRNERMSKEDDDRTKNKNINTRTCTRLNKEEKVYRQTNGQKN